MDKEQKPCPGSVEEISSLVRFPHRDIARSGIESLRTETQDSAAV